jgi:hypothetical protein
MSTTRLYVECPNCHRHYLIKKGALTYGNGAYIENVAGAPEWQRLLCPCRPENPHKFKLSETVRLHVFSNDESERTQFVEVKKKVPDAGPSKAKEGSEQNKTTKGDYSE